MAQTLGFLLSKYLVLFTMCNKTVFVPMFQFERANWFTHTAISSVSLTVLPSIYLIILEHWNIP